MTINFNDPLLDFNKQKTYTVNDKSYKVNDTFDASSQMNTYFTQWENKSRQSTVGAPNTISNPLVYQESLESRDDYMNMREVVSKSRGELLSQPSTIQQVRQSISSATTSFGQTLQSALGAETNKSNENTFLTGFFPQEGVDMRKEDVVSGSNFLNSLTGKLDSAQDFFTSSIGEGLGDIQSSIQDFSLNLPLPNLGTSLSIGSVNPTTFNNSNFTSPITDHRIRIRAKPGQVDEIYGNRTSGPMRLMYRTNGLLFPFTPTINGYNQNVNLTTVSPTHSNQEYYLYNGTSSMNLSISGIFTAQNAEEAEYILAVQHFLKTVTKMRFGDSDPLRGLTPPSLILSGYGEFVFPDLNVIMRTYTQDLADSVDYIRVDVPGGGTAWVPSRMTITIDLYVQNTPRKNRTFNWDKFRDGDLMRKDRGFI